jgi:hypothetical protein
VRNGGNGRNTMMGLIPVVGGPSLLLDVVEQHRRRLKHTDKVVAPGRRSRELGERQVEHLLVGPGLDFRRELPAHGKVGSLGEFQPAGGEGLKIHGLHVDLEAEIDQKLARDIAEGGNARCIDNVQHDNGF